MTGKLLCLSSWEQRVNDIVKNKRLVIYGAGGLGREVKWLVERINKTLTGEQWVVDGFVNTTGIRGQYDEELLGDEEWLFKQKDVFIVLAVGSPKARVEIAGRLEKQFSENVFPVLIDPSVLHDSTSCSFKYGTIVTAGNILTVNIKLQPFSFINLNCTIGHETVIGKGTLLNPTVKMSGGVNVGKGVLIGTGATVLQYLNIGDFSTVGSGAVVTKNVKSDTVVVGVPARVMDKKNER
ncbi:MAG: transferase [Deltaproteobacteria bacterium]|nr:transferase [Deltaproteobacteria bacterium]